MNNDNQNYKKDSIQNTHSTVHIGNKIREVYESKGMRLTVFAERVGTTRQNVYKIFNRKSINLHLLKKISEVLDVDFFKFYVGQDNHVATSNTSNMISEYPNQNPSLSQKIDHIQKELERFEKEMVLRDKIMALMEDKLRMMANQINYLLSERRTLPTAKFSQD